MGFWFCWGFGWGWGVLVRPWECQGVSRGADSCWLLAVEEWEGREDLNIEY